MILVSSYTESFYFRCNSHFTSWAQHYTFLLHDQSEIPKRKRNLADDPTVVSISILGSPATQQGYKFVSRGNFLKTFQRYRGQPEVSQPSRILGAAWEKKRSTLKYIFDLCLHGETIWWSDDQRYILLLICLLTWGNHLRGQHQHQVPPGWGAQSWGSGRRGGEQSQPRAQGFAGKHIFL